VRIGLFDSGVGGLTLLPALRRHLPSAAFHYVADAAHAPYGERSDAEIAARSLRITAHLVEHGAQLIVVACNTATAAAVDALRQAHPGVPIVGVEPGLKPALAASRSGRVGVMATSATLRSARFQALMQRVAAGRTVHLQACVGLADAIEDLEPGDARIAAVVERHVAPLRAAQVDAVALGCTHYLMAHEPIAAALGSGVQVVDTSTAVAAQVVRRLDAAGAAAIGSPGSLQLETTGDAQRLQAVATRWLGSTCRARHVPTL
jgi:glutamate racemase